MCGDAVGASGFAGESGGNRVRFTVAAAAIPRLAQRRDVINVDTEFEHGFLCQR
jgi:hypothetical protein